MPMRVSANRREKAISLDLLQKVESYVCCQGMGRVLGLVAALLTPSSVEPVAILAALE